MWLGLLFHCTSSSPIVFCLATVSLPLANRALQRRLSGAYSFNFHYPLVSLRSSTFCLRLFPSCWYSCLFCFYFSNVFWKAVPTQGVSNTVRLPSFLLFVGYSTPPWLFGTLFSFFTRSVQLLHTSPWPHFRIAKVFMIYYPKCPVFSQSWIYRIAHRLLNSPSKIVSARYVWGRLLMDVTRRCKEVVGPLICFCQESDRTIIP